MLLTEATSAEQVEAALDAGDDELREDIEMQLDHARREWERRDRGYDHDHDPLSMSDVVENSDFVDRVILSSPLEYDLSSLPRETVEEALLRVGSAPARHRHRQMHYGPFYFDDRGGAHFSYKLEMGGNYTFPGHYLPENAKYIPSKIAREFWNSLGREYTWDQQSSLDSDEDNYGHGPGTEVFVDASESAFNEWCRDLMAEYVRDTVKRDPEKAKEIFFKALASEDKALAEKLKEAKLDDDELLEFVNSWFESDSDKEEVLETIRDYFTALESPTTPERELVAEFSKQDIAAMGINKGTLFENAPWKLIKLHPSDLRMEGTLMGHCVGKAGMGYVRAVRDGEIEIWSLRSRDNKPRFTLEVDSKFYDADKNAAPRSTPAVLRAHAIDQLKGKANRTPGYADVRRAEIKFPDEVVFWAYALKGLGIDPEQVDDFVAFREELDELREELHPNDGEQCVGFDRPYRSRVRQNRRSSRRRTSRRRSSKIRS